MVDLHTHILPDMDDGASSCTESVRLLEMELNGGVDTVALTPHFVFGRESVASFAQRRAQAIEKLRTAAFHAGLAVGLVEGAEVFLSPEVLKADDKRLLCYRNTGFMLVELPDYYEPEWLPDVLAGLRQEGITPVVAHIERYPYLLREPQKLIDMIGGGALMQINADALLRGGRHMRARIYRLMEHDMVHIIASDTHSAVRRPPNLGEAYRLLAQRYIGGEEAYFGANSRAVLENRAPEIAAPRPFVQLFRFF